MCRSRSRTAARENTVGGPRQEERGVDRRGVENRLGRPQGAPKARDVQTIEQTPVSVPKASWTEPLREPNYIDRLAESVSLDGDTYLVHWSKNGRRYSAPVPDQWIVRERNRVTRLNSSPVYGTRQAALEALAPSILAGGFNNYIGFWTNQEVPVIVPTLFTDVSTPRIMAAIEAKDEDMRQGAREAEETMRGLASGMLMGKALGLAYSAARNPNFAGYRLLDRLTEPAPARPVPTTPRTLPAAEPTGSSSRTTPPAPGATSSTRPPQAGAPTQTRPPISGSTTSSRSPLNQLLAAYRIRVGEVLGTAAPPASEVATTVVGREREAQLIALLRNRFPLSQLRINFTKGPDVEWIGGADPGFDILDLKPMPRPPNYESYGKFVRQVQEWSSNGWAGRDAPETFRAAMLSYDPQGNYYIEDIGTVGPNYYTPAQQLDRPPKPRK